MRRRPFGDPAQLVDAPRMHATIQDATRRTVLVRLGTLTSSRTVVAHGTHQFSASYSTGGEDVTLPPVPNLQQVGAFPDGGYNFEYVSGTGKLKAYTGGGAEVAGGFDLSARTAILSVFGQLDDRLDILSVDRAETLLRAYVRVETEIDLDSSNYWTAQLVRVLEDGSHEELGGVLSSEGDSIGADSAIELYAPTGGLALTTSQALALDLAVTGSPQPLVELVVGLELGRRA